MLSPNFVRAWQEWLKRPIPADDFRNQHANSPTYELEHDIDHSVSYIQGLVQSLIAGKDLDYEKLASKELLKIEQLIAKLNRSELANEDKQKFLSYLCDTMFILKALGPESSNTP